MPLTNVRFSTNLIAIEFSNSLDAGKTSLLYKGSLADSLKIIQSEPPTAIELEALIDLVENELMPILGSLPEPRKLAAYRFEVNSIISSTDTKQPIPNELDIDTVERLFNRLARVANGAPAKHEGVPEDRGFAVRLVWLRELMHHGGFRTVKLI